MAHKDREKRLAYVRAWYAKNREKQLAYYRARYAKNPETARALRRDYYAKNRDRAGAFNRAYYAKNREKLAAYRRSYSETHREEERARKAARQYGVSLRDAEMLVSLRDGPGAWCDICRTQEGPFNIDHNHNTGKIRGILCRQCNVALSHLEMGFPVEEARAYLRGVKDVR
jgi:recombination endonuclease VII